METSKINKMTAKAAICLALLKGEVLNIGTGFRLLGVTNLPREIGRSVERSFHIEVSRSHQEGKSRYNVPCTWVNYRLNKTDYNSKGIENMKSYVREQIKGEPNEKAMLKYCQPNLL